MYVVTSIIPYFEKLSLRNFKVLDHGRKANFSCPICGDSAKDQRKARGHIYEDTQRAIYVCYNGCPTTSAMKLLKQLNEPLYHEYMVSNFKDFGHSADVVKPLANRLVPILDVKNSSLEAERYAENRMIPKDHKNVRFSTVGEMARVAGDNFEKFYQNESPCVALLVRNRRSKLCNIICRLVSVKAGYSKYLNFKMSDELAFFGMDTLDFSKPVHILEGAIDSLFVENSIAISGVAKGREAIEWLLDNGVTDISVVPDNDTWTNIQVASGMVGRLEQYDIMYKVMINRFKDINECIVKGEELRFETLTPMQVKLGLINA